MPKEQIVEKLSPLLTDAFHERDSCFLPELPASAQAAIAITLSSIHRKTILWIADGPQSLETTHRDLSALRTNTEPPLPYFPPQESLPTKGFQPDHDIMGYRLAALLALQGSVFGVRCSGDTGRQESGVRGQRSDEGSITGNRVPRVRRKPNTTTNREGGPVSEILPTEGCEATGLVRSRCESSSSGTRASPVASQPFIITTCIQAIMQKTLSPPELQRATLRLAIGQKYDMEQISARLDQAGYEFVPEVLEKGGAAARGGILDVWPLTETWPIRIEFLGTTIESIRSFNPADQKSIDKLHTATIPPLSCNQPSKHKTLLDYLPSDTITMWSNTDSMNEHGSAFSEVMAEASLSDHIVPLDKIHAIVSKKADGKQLFFAGGTDQAEQSLPLNIEAPQGTFELPRELLQPDIMEQARKNLITDLIERARKKQSVLLFFDTQGSLDHFKKTSLKRDKPRNLQLRVGPLSSGFVCEAAELAVVSESDLYGRRKHSLSQYDPQVSGPRPEKGAGSRIQNLADMEPGDLVVHADHGIGKYLGLYEIIVNDQRQEVITVEYADNAKLHIPASQVHLLSRYVGISRAQTRLHRLGGKRWRKEKLNAENSILDLASSLLETQAQRYLLERPPFPATAPWQHEFEASFPYHETSDQTKVFTHVEQDMISTKPMDRLVCGDAGYGKTEVAMRAAFKTVMSAKQIAVLVPTTVLAQQHFETFTERMAPYPVRVEMLSRFCSQKQRGETVKGLSNGTVDIVIGTHALLQPGIKFKDLGLVIIDEEQRFGVEHKERLKQLRKLVDLLTLTATPIPRTLYMSMTGARDMSLLQTPPSERMAIETIVTRSSDSIIREAILHELNREGQVFYLHNRVMTIDRVRARLEKLVPEATMQTAHGRMPSGELSSVMRNFSDGQFDVLLCTTIIESGLDIPRANTILIDRADRFGIADLYQLRGRVGRSSHKAYAYLLLPPDARVDSDARQRISAVKKYSGLSAGFNLALRDLEIRGAGNLLGAAQSGHITAIGFGLYCQLLKRAVSRLKGDTVPPVIDVRLQLDFISLSPTAEIEDSAAMIPYDYIEDEGVRISAHRKLAEAMSADDVDSLTSEFIDRFGPLPPPVLRLLKICRLRIEAANHNITKIETRDGKLMITQSNEYIMKKKRFPRLTSSTPDAQLDEIITLIRKER